MKCHVSPATEMASPQCLQEWCRVTCASYPSVEIKNLSTSFKDGLAFCAIIHKHRPDLIDFSSLSKDNAYENNQLAFEVAEAKLGIPPLLDPKDMVATKVPDCLSVITYLSQYYYFFNRKSCADPSRSWSPHVTVLNNVTKSNTTPDESKNLKSLTNLEASRDEQFVNTRTKAACHLCFKPVHIIQRHLSDGKVYHRSCFRCKVCLCTLLPGSFMQGSDPGSLICACHVTDDKSVHSEADREVKSTNNQPKWEFHAGLNSPGDLTVTSVSHYTKKLESQDRLVTKTPQRHAIEMQEGSREARDREDSTAGPPCSAQPSIKERTVDGAEKSKLVPTCTDSRAQQDPVKPSELSSSCAQVTERSTRPVPAPRRSLDGSAGPIPAPRIKTMSSCPATDPQSPSGSSHITSPKVKTNHPWMAIVHPGPWTQLPPAPAPVPLPRSKSVSNVHMSWNRPKITPPNPFEEEEEEEDEVEGSQGETAKPSEGAVRSDDSRERKTSPGNNTNVEPALSSVKPPVETKVEEDSEDAAAEPAFTNRAEASPEQAGVISQVEALAVTEEASESRATSAQSRIFPRSLSVPGIMSEHSLTRSEDGESVTACQRKPACKENPFNRKSEISKSKTFQDLSSSRGPAPGYGFPLIKRKVQTDMGVSMEDLQAQMRELHRRLEAQEQKGVELERSLREGLNGKAEAEMLTEWFSLIHEQQILSRKESELVYLIKQQKLEDRQADVEYELRCLLVKPEGDWSREDRHREQQLLVELVTIIEQRNQIISNLDQDRQRERGEDVLWEGMVRSKDSQKELLKELKKSRRKFKPSKVFKLLNYKTESSKDSVQKKN